MSNKNSASVSLEKLIKSKIDKEDEFHPEEYGNLILDGENIQ
jgi:hypothetical protein